MRLQQNLTGNLYPGLKCVKHLISNSNRYKLTKQVNQYLQSDDCIIPDEEKPVIQKWFSMPLVHQISYPFIKKYLYRKVNIFFDNKKSLHYVLHSEKRLYFKKGMSKHDIRELYNNLCIEQDINSPHSYLAFPVHYQSTDIAVDIGAAEGIWALDIIEKVKEIYLFECEDAWIEALQATFEPWSDKIHIVNKFVSDVTDEVNTTLDDYFLGKNIVPDIIKADIEGAEASCIKGASKLLTNHVRHFLLCTYHNYDDYRVLSEMMKSHGFETQPSKGYMLTIYMEPNYSCKDASKIVRKGLIHAYK